MTLRPLALLHAMRAEFDEARRLIRKANEVLEELDRMQSAVSYHEAAVELLAGRSAAAERRLRPDYAKLETIGEHSLLATTAALLAQAVVEQNRCDEAEALSETAERHADAHDLVTPRHVPRRASPSPRAPRPPARRRRRSHARRSPSRRGPIS